MRNKKLIIGIILLAVGLMFSLIVIVKFQNKVNILNKENLVL